MPEIRIVTVPGPRASREHDHRFRAGDLIEDIDQDLQAVEQGLLAHMVEVTRVETDVPLHAVQRFENEPAVPCEGLFDAERTFERDDHDLFFALWSALQGSLEVLEHLRVHEAPV